MGEGGDKKAAKKIPTSLMDGPLKLFTLAEIFKRICEKAKSILAGNLNSGH